MIPSNRILEQRINEGARAARCILGVYRTSDLVSAELGSKIAFVVDRFIELEDSPNVRQAFFEWAHVARTKTFVNRRHMSFMFHWWELMSARSELWRIVKRGPNPIPCAR